MLTQVVKMQKSLGEAAEAQDEGLCKVREHLAEAIKKAQTADENEPITMREIKELQIVTLETLHGLVSAQQVTLQHAAASIKQFVESASGIAKMVDEELDKLTDELGDDPFGTGGGFKPPDGGDGFNN